MKTLISRTFTNRFPILLITVALLFTGGVFVWFVWHIFGYDETQLSATHQHSVWYAAATVLILVIFLAVCVKTIRILHKSYESFLINNAERKQTEEALQQSEARFRELFENANDLVYTTDFQGNFTSLNKAGEAISGYTRDELCKMNFTAVVVPEQHDLARQMPANRKKNDAPTSYEIEIINKNGARVMLDISSRLIYEAGEPIGVQGIGRDITARRHAEDTLRESEARYRVVTESASDAILTIDQENTILFANPAAEKIFGYAVDELLGSKFFMLIPENLRGARGAGMRYGNETNIRNIFLPGVEIPVLHKDGHEVPVEVTFGEINSDGKRLFTAVIRDITERKRAEEKIRESNEWLQAIFNVSRDGIVIEDGEKVVYINKSYTDLLGYDEPDELIGKQISELLSPEDAERMAEFGRRRLRGDWAPSLYEFKYRRKDGALIESEGAVTTAVIGGKKYIMTASRDITGRKRAEAELQKNLSLLTSTFEATTDAILVVDLENKIVTYNRNYVDMGRIPDEIIKLMDNAKIINFVLDQLTDAEAFIKKTQQLVLHPEVHSFDIIEFKDGRLIERYSHPQMLEGKVIGRVISFRDITERKLAVAALHESESRYRLLVESTNEGLLQVDNDDRTQFVNDRLCEMVGYSPDEMMKANWTCLLLDDEGRNAVEQVNKRRRKGFSDRYELSLKTKSGEVLWMIVGGAPIINADGIITGSMGVFTDITERKRAEEQLLYDAFHDGLTGLANRALFMDHLQMTIERGKSRRSNIYAVLFLDFDRFKIINDSLGHAEGDRLLKQIVLRLESSTRTGDLVARFGGDEFVVLLCEMLDDSEAVQIAERIQNSLKKSFDLNGNEVFVSASIGIALSTAGHKRAEDMLRDADIAMYRAKAKGRARYQVFDQTMHQQATTQLQLETELRQAFERGEFELFYQPIINLVTNELAGFEALVRWIHPKRGIIFPMEFIPVAEETGLILPLGRWILDQSCRQLREWQNAHLSALPLIVSVNLSCKQFLQSDLAEQIAQTLSSTGLEPRCLKLEITESYLMENSEKAVQIMKRLCSLGVELSLDDFGTGYSSLSYLHRLPVGYLKIDRSFISRMTESNENSEIVLTIIKLAQNLKMKVIAEGIETAEQLLHLKNQDCEYGQGYFFSQPLDAAAAEKFIEQNAENFPFIINQTDVEFEMNM